MSNTFAIDFEWLERFTPDEAERVTFADIKITVGEGWSLRNLKMSMPRPSDLLHVSRLMQWRCGCLLYTSDAADE